MSKRIGISKYAAIMTLGFACGISAFAAETGDPATPASPHMGWHRMSPEKMHEEMAKRQAALHDQLKLTAAQEPAWKAYLAAIAPSQTDKPWGDRAAMDKLSAPERMEKHLAMMKEHEARAEAHLAALKTFYATLTPAQRATFDKATSHAHAHHGPHGGDMMPKQ